MVGARMLRLALGRYKRQLDTLRPRHLRARPLQTERTLLGQIAAIGFSLLKARVTNEHTEGLGVYSGYPDEQSRHSDKESRARE